MMRKRADEWDYVIRRNYLAKEDTEIGLNVYKGNKIKKVDVEEDDPYYDVYDYEREEEEYPYGPYDPYDSGERENDQKLKIKLGEKYVNKNNGYLIEQNTNIIE